MSISKYLKAYCIELEQEVSPYFAKELYFNKDSDYYGMKLNYKCTFKDCNAELYGVSIYSFKRNKKTPHFRKKPSTSHDRKCDYFIEDKVAIEREPEKIKLEGEKISRFPSVFLLNGFPKKIAGIKITDDEIEAKGNKVSKSISHGRQKSDKEGQIRTSILDNLVDCFEKGDRNLLKSHIIQIGRKKKYFLKFFKNIKYFKDEEGLIYWGKVKEIKKYGENYRVIFEDRPHIEGNYLIASIYITKNMLDKYSKKANFLELLEELVNSNDNITCYFVGTYPEVVELEKDSIRFKVIDIKIDNLNHISFTTISN